MTNPHSNEMATAAQMQRWRKNIHSELCRGTTVKISGASLPPPSCRLDSRCRSWQERQQNRKEKRKVLKGKRACADCLKVRAALVAVEVFAVAAHAENAEHVRVGGVGKGADFLRARAVAVRALDLGRAGGGGGFAGGLGRSLSRTISRKPFFPIFKCTWIEFG